jgi:hypothetical protein
MASISASVASVPGDLALGLFDVGHGCLRGLLGINHVADGLPDAMRRELLCEPVVYAADDRVFAKVDAEPVLNAVR